jgi:hypothetical protein
MVKLKIQTANVNVHSIDIYLQDTQHTILNRIVASLQTPLELLQIKWLSDDTIDLLDLKHEIIKTPRNDYIELYNKYFSTTNKIKFIQYWAIYNHKLDDYDTLDIAIRFLDDPDYNWNAFTIDVERLKILLNQQISNAKRSDVEFVNVYTSRSIQPIIFDPFETISIQKSYDYNLNYPSSVENSKELNIFEVFDNLNLLENVPFALVKGDNNTTFYKILPDTTPSYNWSRESPDVKLSSPHSLLVKVNNKYYKEYISVWILPNRKIFINFPVTIHLQNAEIEILNAIRTSLKINISNDYISKRNISFNVSSTTPCKFNTPTWKLFLLTDKLYSPVIIHNDMFSNRRMKFRSYFRIHYNDKNCLASIFIKNGIISGTLSHITNYDDITSLLKVLANALSFYNFKFDSYSSDYKNIIGTTAYNTIIADYTETDITEKTKQDPNRPSFMNAARYNRAACGTDRQPTTKLKPDGYVVPQKKANSQIVFPLTQININEKQYIFDCSKNKKYPYIGLKKSMLGNTISYEYIPCCYQNEQTEKIDRYNKDLPIEKEIIEAKEDEKVSKVAKYVYITNKIVESGGFAILPESLERLFKFMYPTYLPTQYRSTLAFSPGRSTSALFFRMGVKHSSRTVLDCLLHKNNDFNITNIQSRIKSIIKHSTLHLQNTYNYTKQELLSIVDDDKKYMDPVAFHSILEEVFNVNIFIFTRNDNNPNGTLTIPIAKRILLASRPSANRTKTIALFVHSGTETFFKNKSIANELYPHCELIIGKNSAKATTFVSVFEDHIIYNNLSTLRDSMINTQYVPRIQFKGKIYSAYTDFFFKVRWIKFEKTKLVIFSLIDGIMLDSYVEDWKQNTIPEIEHNVTETQLLQFELEENVQINRSTLQFVKDNTTFVIMQPQINSQQEALNELRKLANALTEYTLYLFSLSLLMNNNHSPTEKDLKDFVYTNILIDKNVRYFTPSPTFNLETGINGGIIRHNQRSNIHQIVVQNITTRNKLWYVSYLQLRRNKNIILSYQSKVFLKNYYTNALDFERSHSIILEGMRSFTNWIAAAHEKDTHIYSYPRYGSSTIEYVIDLAQTKEYLKFDINKNKKKIIVLCIINEWDVPFLNQLFALANSFKNILFMYTTITVNPQFVKNMDLSLIPSLIIGFATNIPTLSFERVKTYENLKVDTPNAYRLLLGTLNKMVEELR